MSRYVCAAAFCALLALNVTSVLADLPIEDDAVLLSAKIDVPVLARSIATSEMLAKSCRFDLAAKELDYALSITSAYPFLDQEIPRYGSVRLCLESARLYYMMKATRSDTDSDRIAGQCRLFLADYATNAMGKDWYAIELLLSTLVDYAQRSECREAFLEACERLVRYAPGNMMYTFFYLDRLHDAQCITTNTMAILDCVIPLHDHDVGFTIRKCRVLRIARKDAFSALLTCMRRFPVFAMCDLQQIVELGSALVNENPALRQQRYCTALTNLALAQRQDRMTYVTSILAEREKWRGQSSTNSPVTPVANN